MSLVICQSNSQYCINISEHYCSHWEDDHAFREALQNWMDAWKTKYQGKKLMLKFQENKMLKIHKFLLTIDGVVNTHNYIKYDQVNRTLKMENEGSFNIHNLLMGSTSKKANNEALGQYGEGMKLFFMILLKKGYRLFIESGSHVYAPTLKQWQFSSYESQVLYVNVKPRNPVADNTSLTITNVSMQKFNYFRHLSLMLVTDYEVIQYPKMRLIISKNALIGGGKIFKKGVLVGLRYHLESIYSYDFDDIQIGRDRDSVNNPQQLKQLCSTLYAKILNDYEIWQNNNKVIDEMPKILKEIFRLLKKCSFDIYTMHSYINAEGANRIYRQFLIQRNLGQVYPVSSSADQVQVNTAKLTYGLSDNFYSTVIVGCHLNANLRRSTYYQSINQKVQKQILQKSKRDLSDSEKNQLDQIKLPLEQLIPKLKYFSFKVQQIQGVPCYQNGTQICINRFQMVNTQKFRLKLMKLLTKDE